MKSAVKKSKVKIINYQLFNIHYFSSFKRRKTSEDN